MSYRAEKAGIAAEAQAKMKAKYDPEMSTQILEWIAEVTGESINTDGSEENFYEVLRTGALLCKLLNTISEGAVKKYNPNTTMAFKCMDNINSFLLGLDAIGVPVEDRFQTVDLWEQVNLHSVQICLQAMGRKAPKFGVKGFGPKEANENRRTFTEEQLKQGETIINLQMGSNKGASQSGMTFGKSTRF